ncbi:biotin/lipoyl-binding protein [Pseudonocardia kunmingensis]|nr:biotin/lipoyl-binding protein [Pseudonocardia kunmingensis]
MDRHRRVLPAAASSALVVLLLAACTGEEPTQARTAPVERAAVTSGVSATGSMSSVTQQNMGFPNGGQLTNVFVKVGDHVEPGQVLATIDDFALRQTLEQQQGQLRSQQAMLDQLVNSPAVGGAKDTHAQAEEILEATRKQAEAVVQADETAIDNAERQLSIDKKAREQAEDKVEASRKACDGGSSGDFDFDFDGGSGGNGGSGGSSGGGDDDGDNDSDGDGDGGSDGDGDGDSDSSGASGSASATPASFQKSSFDPACLTLSSDESALMQAKQKVVASEAALDNAKEQRDVDKTNGDLAIENARQAVVNARNNANSAASDRPFEIEQQRGAVIAAQAAVANAQRDLDNATLRAPVAGTVSVLNGVVGEFLSPGSGTSALAPGSAATIPGVDASAGAAAAAAGPVNPTRPGGAAPFLVLDDVNAFQVVVPFNESDAATIVPNQKVEVAVDALPDLTLTGSVLSVAPTGTSIAGVISYYVTAVVDGSDPRLKDGQTVRATVVTEEIGNVLSVPSAAVRQENGKSTVTVVEPDGAERPVPFEAGKVGAGRTQVLSGLREGQQVVLPATR